MRAKAIRELVKIVEESMIGELEISYWWGRKIRISKTASAMVGNKSTTAVMPMVSAVAPPVAVPTSGETLKATTTEVKPEEAKSDHLVEIKSPMVGTFYRAPAPDAEPYVREGDMISPGKVLCIIEAMKLMNEIEAEISGKIVKILVENAKPVEYNQPLFLVDVSGR